MKTIIRQTNWLIKSSFFEDLIGLALISGIIFCLVTFPV